MELITLQQNIFAIDSFLPEAECTALIELAETEGFVAADVQLPEGRQLIKNIRNNERADYHSLEPVHDLAERRIAASK